VTDLFGRMYSSKSTQFSSLGALCSCLLLLAFAPCSLSFSVARILSVSPMSTANPSSMSTARSKKTYLAVTSSSSASSSTPSDIDIITTNAKQLSDEEKNAALTQNCKALCQVRNLPLEKVKNARDLASVCNSKSPIQPGRVFRMGRIGDATDADMDLLLQNPTKMHLKTLVDLRSPTELKDDPTLLRPEVFGEFANVVWQEQGRGKAGCLKLLDPGENPVKKHFWNKGTGHKIGTSKSSSKSPVDIDPVMAKIDELQHDDDDDDDANISLTADDVVSKLEETEDEMCTVDCEDPDDPEAKSSPTVTVSAAEYTGQGKERHFVSLMNEFKYVKGTVSKLRKREVAKAILKSPGALVSRRVRSSVKKPFLDEINDGGLPMLNELLLRFGAPGIKYVLDLCADRNRHPITFYCTAGKDRTGMIAAILLALVGVSVDDIVEDYTLSANVYAEMNDHQAMVGALSQRNLNAATFLGAPPQVMREIMESINEHYGSVEGYCNWIGFGPEQQEKLRRALLDP
jgi:protein tyrosine/serine phosphatase